MMTRKNTIACAAIALLFSMNLARSADPVEKENIKLADLAGRFDLAVPQSPAFTILGLTPENVVSGDVFRTTALGVLQGLDARGNLQSGIAVDFRPYIAIRGAKSTLADYNNSDKKTPLTRLLSNTQLSFATASGQSDSDRADRMSLGLRVTLWQQNDPANFKSSPALAYVPPEGHTHKPEALGEDPETGEKVFKGTVASCYNEYLAAAAKSPDIVPITDDEMTQVETTMAENARKAVSKCLAPYKEKYWNTGSLELGVAGYRSKVDPLDESGSGAWLAYSYAFNERAQIVARASKVNDRLEPLEDNAGEYRLVDETNAGLRFRFGTPRGSMMVEGQWVEAKTGGVTEEYTRASAGFEFMLFGDIWLQLAVGKAFGTDAFDDDPIYSGQFRFGFSDKSVLKPGN